MTMMSSEYQIIVTLKAEDRTKDSQVVLWGQARTKVKDNMPGFFAELCYLIIWKLLQ